MVLRRLERSIARSLAYIASPHLLYSSGTVCTYTYYIHAKLQGGKEGKSASLRGRFW